MIKINLLPVKEAKKKATIQNQVILAVVVLMVVLAGLGYVAFHRKQTIGRLNSEISQKKTELARLQETQKKVEQFKKDNENLQQKLSIITGLESGRDWYLQVIDQLGEAMPSGVWIETLNTPTGGAKGGAGIYTGSWEIVGGALEKDQIGNLISNLENRNKYFASVVLKRIVKKSGLDLGEYFIYEMSINVTPPPKTGAEAG